MGVMSKTNRLPERPKPPSWTQVNEDMTAATENDVVFVLGQDYLVAATAVPPQSPQEKAQVSSSATLEADSTNQNAIDIDMEKVRSSNSDVLKLIAFNTELTESVNSLQEQYDRLKLMREELSQSSSELKVLAENISLDMNDKIGNFSTAELSSVNEKCLAASEKGSSVSEKNLGGSERSADVSERSLGASKKSADVSEKGLAAIEITLASSEKSSVPSEKSSAASEKSSAASEKRGKAKQKKKK